MLEVIKKNLKLWDYVIFAIAVFMFSNFDYSNLNIIDIIYIVSFVMWFIMLGFRLFIIYRGNNKKGGRKH